MRATARRAAVALAGAALAISALAGCGDDDGGSDASSAPDDASKADFCEGFAKLYAEVLGDAQGDPSTSVEGIKAWAEDMADLGTPADMPEEARKGFEVFLDTTRELPDDATLDDLDSLGGDLSEAEQRAGDEFGQWAAETCASELMGDLPTELPSDLPTDLDPSALESTLSELTASMDAG
ncbi:hypothetical protein [Nocardioides caricicola]|uniref:Uncharacterized protein n=1 Tax=Nocardioides caricicola TaxID=634770 RepID=A0ABW0MZA4_9ACTN